MHTSLQGLDLSPEPDLHPLYPTQVQIAPLLSPHSGLSPAQKTELVSHCLARACTFGDLSLVSYLLSDSHAQSHVDLGFQDEDGLGLVSLTIYGFGAESERDVEREECVRLLIAQGANLNVDKAGWSPLHHAALLSPPTLISHLMTHGCSVFAVTHRNLTALDIITGHSVLPGREDVAHLLEESMRGEGWTGGRMEEIRKLLDQRVKRHEQRRNERLGVERLLGVNCRWWEDADSDTSSEDDAEDLHDIYTPPADYASMLVFSPMSLPHIFDSLITEFPPSLGNSQPANALYLLARFACLTCDHNWLEELIIGATDAIEETFFNHAEDLNCLLFWLYNTTIWLHHMQCDKTISEACSMLGSFDILEEVINSVFVFVIRFAERRIDQLLDSSLLNYSSPSSDVDSVQFESDWSFFRPFSSKKRISSTPSPLQSGATKNGLPSSPPPSNRPPSPSNRDSISTSTSRLSSIFNLSRPITPSQAGFPATRQTPAPADLTSFLTALHTLLSQSDINPAFVTQIWSQVLYWTSCEIFNRILTRKNYLCRSRAAQVSMNLDVLENWVTQTGLPPGVRSHFVPVHDLLGWLQRLSSIGEFSDLVSTIQSLKSINPLQMRRAVRDYKYEVNEPRMKDECVQYLTQLQKDWERHRVKLGVEALRKEISDRDTDRAESESSFNHSSEPSNYAPSVKTVSSNNASMPRQSIDVLFEGPIQVSSWEPLKAPQILGELLDSRYMLPLLLPSDPRMLHTPSASFDGRPRFRKLHEVRVETLYRVDGQRSGSRWFKPTEFEDDEESSTHSHLEPPPNSDDLQVDPHVMHLTRKPSGRKGRHSHTGEQSS